MTARILVVDDIEVNLRLLSARLAAEYYDVLTADSGEAALEVLAQQPVDLVLLDVMMPGMDGIETYKRLREIPKLAETPVVFMTAKAMTHEIENYRDMGAPDLLANPLYPTTLAALLPEISYRAHAGAVRGEVAPSVSWRL